MTINYLKSYYLIINYFKYFAYYINMTTKTNYKNLDYSQIEIQEDIYDRTNSNHYIKSYGKYYKTTKKVKQKIEKILNPIQKKLMSEISVNVYKTNYKSKEDDSDIIDFMYLHKNFDNYKEYQKFIIKSIEKIIKQPNIYIEDYFYLKNKDIVITISNKKPLGDVIPIPILKWEPD